MNHDFSESMAKLSNDELIKIITLNRQDYKENAIIAAEKELKIRNISEDAVEKEKEKLIEDENKKIEPLICPNCGTKLKSGFLSGVTLLSKNKTIVINEYHDKINEFYCNKCGNELYTKYSNKINNEINKLSTELERLILSIPVVSTHSPLNWDYEVLNMVTGQSTTGTGVISEVASSFTDLFGAQSGKYNSKLKAGEDLCFAQLRRQTIELGGNAIIATDIDYSEVGGAKGMLMVCMGGTAIKLKNIELLGQERSTNLKNIAKIYEKLNRLYSFAINEF